MYVSQCSGCPHVGWLHEVPERDAADDLCGALKAHGLVVVVPPHELVLVVASCCRVTCSLVFNAFLSSFAPIAADCVDSTKAPSGCQ